MMAYGGPQSLEEVEPYLLDVRGGRPTVPQLVEEIRERYRQIGRRSPLLSITQAQAKALEDVLNADGDRRFRTYVGMRHWHPYIRDAVGQIVEDGARRMVALCMAPHYSRMSVGAYFQKVREALDELGADLEVTYIDSWNDHPGFIEAVAKKIIAALATFPAKARDRVTVIFTAHSLPARIVGEGDPYPAELQESVDLVVARTGIPHWRFCYQSAGRSPEPWLGPSIEEVISSLAAGGVENMLIVPLGFVADHVEVLYDIDIACRRLASQHGARLERSESLNASPTLISALADLVRERVAA